MSQEYYVVCRECRKKAHIGCIGFSGLQFWSKDEPSMKAMKALLTNCFSHFDKLAFVWEGGDEVESYEDISRTDSA